MISSLSAAMASILVSPKLQAKRYRMLRLCTFITTALSGFAPLIHGYWILGGAFMVEDSGMPFYLL